jgi:HK97 family phage portal protein
MSNIAKQLASVEKMKQLANAKEAILIQKAMESTSPSDILAAQKVLETIDKRQQVDKKSFIVDPWDFNNSFGYKDKPYSLSYGTLKAMSKTPIINAIIKTRKNQIADFAEPQADKYSTGFVIRRKKKGNQTEEETPEGDTEIIEEIQDFILNCGKGNKWEGDDFETFIRKITEDSLVYDQLTFEIVRDFSGKPYEYFATDASTYRIADSYSDDDYDKETGEGQREMINGYYPSYVQIYNGNIKADFYPWELCFAARNPTTSIHNVGYGVSELEELVSVITSLLWAEDYNKKFFSQGSAPKGLLRVKGKVNEKQLNAFRQEWTSMVTGVSQAWKTPIVDADIDWIDLQKNNRDMEYSAWTEFLIKVSCAIFSISPDEIGFNISGSEGQKSMFESNNEGRLKHSKDKGLYPILKFIQRKINKYLVNEINPDFEFSFVGLNGMTIQEELDIEIKKLGNFQTLDETRKKFGMKPIISGDIILNPTYTQRLMMKEQAQQNPMNNNENPFMQGINDEDNADENGDDGSDSDDENDNPFITKEDEENPFFKGFQDSLIKR